MIELSKSITQEITHPALVGRGIRLFIKRDDLIHDEVSGNKWRKLKYNVELCRINKQTGIITFGGAYSNHLVATAAACHQIGLKSVGIVRGDELSVTSNDTLKRCYNYGMDLHFISREMYSLKNEKSFQESLSIQFPNHLVVPEGGANYYGMIGCQEIMKEVSEEIDHVFVAQGTTATSCGILLGLNETQKLNVIPVLKGFNVEVEMRKLLVQSTIEGTTINDLMEKVVIHDQYHFGGYGKYDSILLNFIKQFFRDYQIKLDPIYTGKAMFGLFNEIEMGRFENTNLLFIHTGGIQGSSSIEKKEGINLYELG